MSVPAAATPNHVRSRDLDAVEPLGDVGDGDLDVGVHGDEQAGDHQPEPGLAAQHQRQPEAGQRQPSTVPARPASRAAR